MVTLVEAVGVAAVGEAFEFAQQFGGERLAGHRVVDRLAIGLAGARHVVGTLGAPFDLQGIDADFHQPVHVLDGAQILRVEDVGAVLVFLDRHQFAGALLLFEQDFLIAGGMQLVIPAAGIGATALVRVAMVEVAGEQAAAGVGDAQRAMDEDLEFDVRALLADFSDFVERQLAR